MAYLDMIRDYNIRQALPAANKVALLVIDLQQYFDGIVAPILDNVLALINACRSARVQIVYTRHGHLNPQKDGGMLATWWGDLIEYGSTAWGLNRKLKPSSSELILDKVRYTAFHGTDLDVWLRQNRVEDLIICGVMTNCCCETTARDAFVRDYRVFFVADATATVNEELHVASLKNLAFGFSYILETEELCRYLVTDHPR